MSVISHSAQRFAPRHYLILLILLAALAPDATNAAISYVRSASVEGTSFAMDIGSPGTNRLVIVTGTRGLSPGTLTGVTVDGKSCALVRGRTNTHTRNEMWYCDEDNLGSSNGSVTIAISGGDSDWGISAQLFTGVGQTGPYDSNDAAGPDGCGSSLSSISVTNVDVPASGLVAMSSSLYIGVTSSGSWTSWTSPLTERQDFLTSRVGFGTYYNIHGVASDIETTAQTNKTYTSSASVNGVCVVGIVASWPTVAPGLIFSNSVAVAQGATINGSISKSSGSFVIDHPLDPKNKLLYHSFVESPDAKNLYDGVAIVGKKGEARIELPSYFLALNKDMRYFANALDRPMPNLYVQEEARRKKWLGLIPHGKPYFIVAGGVPGGEITWQVTGIRRDPFILANPIIPEVEKSDLTIVKKGMCLFKPLCPAVDSGL